MIRIRRCISSIPHGHADHINLATLLPLHKANPQLKFLVPVLELGGIHLYHAGDTLVTQRLIEDVKRHGPIHIACLPINGVDAERHQRGIIGNMDCRDAVYLAKSIGADLTLPMHFDMVMGNEENPLVFGYNMQNQAPGVKYHVMSLGERYLYMICQSKASP